jgi:tripartite-type tricarboxylate transporter receptor subunit TctC
LANPGKLILGSAGIGSPNTVAGELFKMKTGLDLPVVHYRGAAPAVADLLGGHVQAMFDVMADSIEHIRAGRLRRDRRQTKQGNQRHPCRSLDEGAICRFEHDSVPWLPAEFGQFIAEDTEKWRKVVKFVGLKAD